MRYYIGADLGTSAIKLLLVNEIGEVINEVSESYPLFSPKTNYSEQNPIDWFNAFKKGIKSLIKEINKEDIKGISFGGQMHGLVMLDENGEVIRPCLLWNDGRSSKETEYLNNHYGKEYLVNHTGNFAFAGFTLPKLLWVKNNEPDNFKKIKMILLPKDYLVYKITGKYCSDYSDAAGTLYLDVNNKCWSKEMCDIAGIDFSVLPELKESFDNVGKIIPALADELGLPYDISIAMGAGDNAASAIGMGISRHGGCNISLGTSGTVFATLDNFVKDSSVALHSFNHANGKYHLMGCILNGASANKWWIENILNGSYHELTEFDVNNLGNNNVYFLPYLTGERCPHNDVDISGAFIGLRSTTTRQDMSLSILEGVVFALNNCLELIRNKGIEINKVTLCGGGCKTKIWPIIVANVLDVEVVMNQTEQGPAYGAAILAMVSSGLYKNVDEAIDKLIKPISSIKPIEEVKNRYKEKYNTYLRIYPNIKNI